MKYKVSDTKEQTVDVTIEGEKIFLNGELADIDLANISSEKFHVLKNNESYNLQVLEADLEQKTFKIQVNEQVFNLNLEDALDQQLRDMGMSKTVSDKVDKVNAPMPGLVLKILVQPGQEVKKGDSLIILEAMKMENIIKCMGNGIVKNILIREKDAVEKSQVLIEME
ncbi:MAG TPA: biotin/lipoyl-containing protein [Chitinophagales bacterium]|nr:biotin/lipoyl-containing protein [Chitinophagales bacterium]